MQEHLTPLQQVFFLLHWVKPQKTIPFAVADVKQYSFQVTWGEQRTTDDAEGAIVNTC